MIKLHNKVYDKLLKLFKENIVYLLTLVIVIFIFNYPLAYSIEIPGGFISLNDRVKIADQYQETGEFGMAYVSVIKGTIPSILASYIVPDWDVIKNTDMTYSNENLDQMNYRDKLYQNEAVANAEYVAYTKSNNDISINNTKLIVAYIDSKDTGLKINDIITKVNGIEVNTLQDILNQEENQDSVDLTVIRGNNEMNITVPLTDYNDSKKMGVIIIPNYDITANPEFNISEKDNESGPSGGLMMSISIYDKLTGENLSKGDKIIGTGTISMDGTVGEIGGVKYKLIGAVNHGAKVFICPEENYEEAMNIAKEKKYDIEIVSVKTFDDAINYLRSR